MNKLPPLSLFCIHHIFLIPGLFLLTCLSCKHMLSLQLAKQVSLRLFVILTPHTYYYLV